MYLLSETVVLFTIGFVGFGFVGVVVGTVLLVVGSVGVVGSVELGSVIDGLVGSIGSDFFVTVPETVG